MTAREFLCTPGIQRNGIGAIIKPQELILRLFKEKDAMGLLEKMLSLLAAGTMVLSGALDEAAPQHNADGTLFLLNREYRVSDAYQPEDLVLTDVLGRERIRELRPEAAAALEEMFAACKAEIGVDLIAVSGFRDYAKQSRLWQEKLKSVGRNVEKAQEYVAPPGASEHQLGLAMDIGQRGKAQLSSNFIKTEGGKWATENCWRFGFILRYNEGWESVTGYKYEPWHFRYVGRELAKEIHDANVPFETWLIGYRVRVLQEMMKEDGP